MEMGLQDCESVTKHTTSYLIGQRIW